MARHQQVAGLGEARVDLRDIAGDDHRVDVGPGDQDAVDDVGLVNRSVTSRSAGRTMQLGTNSNWVVITRATTRAVRVDARAQILLGELGRQVQRLRVDDIRGCSAD